MGLTTISFKPLTGRTHQLRRHAARDLGRPILGDHRYGKAVLDQGFHAEEGSGLFLCALEVEFPKPGGEGWIVARGDEPTKFEAARQRAIDITLGTTAPVGSEALASREVE